MKSRLHARDQLRRHTGAALLMIAGLGLSACAAAQTPDKVTISVDSTPSSSPTASCAKRGTLYLCADPDPVTTSGTYNQPVKIEWMLTGAGATFDNNKGIDIKKRKNWTKPHMDSPTQYSSSNKKEKNGPLYKYEVNVLVNGTALDPWDPTIMN